jgi:hypothetical protein
MLVALGLETQFCVFFVERATNWMPVDGTL